MGAVCWLVCCVVLLTFWGFVLLCSGFWVCCFCDLRFGVVVCWWWLWFGLFSGLVGFGSFICLQVFRLFCGCCLLVCCLIVLFWLFL